MYARWFIATCPVEYPYDDREGSGGSVSELSLNEVPSIWQDDPARGLTFGSIVNW